MAEDVEKVNPDLVARDNQGKVYTVRYEAVNAMLLTIIAQLNKDMETVVVYLKEQDSRIEKVSAQIEMSKPAPQVVVNKP